jgi:hypothetical protein
MNWLAVCVLCLSRIQRVSSRIHLRDQPGQHAPDFVEACLQRRVLLVGKQSKVAGQEKEVFQLARRAGGDIEKLAELRPAGSGGSFRDVGRHRSCRSPHLAGNSVALVFRKDHSRGIDAQGHCMALLPDLELLKVLHFTPPVGFRLLIYLQLITNNCQLIRGISC